jgi:type 1 glutamine amidotransferase
MKLNDCLLIGLVASASLLFAESSAHSHERPIIAIMVGEAEYRTAETLPEFADRHLKEDYRVRWILEDPEQENHFPNVEQVDQADVLLLSVRRKTLPEKQLEHIRRFERDGKPIIGVRTANHAFCLRKDSPPEGMAEWRDLDAEVFGGNYTNHFPKGSISMVSSDLGNRNHPILAGVATTPFKQGGTLYRTSPLADRTNILWVGELVGNATKREPVAWTFTRANGGKSFYTSLGHPADFENKTFNLILRQAIDWAVDH